MIGDSIQVNYDGTAKVLKKINQDGYSSEYFLDDNAGSMKHTIWIKHTLPTKKNLGESHLMKYTVDYIDSETGAIIRSVSSWGVMRTDTTYQDLVLSQTVQAAFLSVYSEPVFTTKMLGRES